MPRALVVFLGLSAMACGAALGEVQDAADADAEVEDDPSDPLRGAWWTGVDPDGDPLPCPLEVEILADGSAELNYLSDDSPEKACGFARVPVVREAGDPPVVRFAGQLSACLWRREGPLLRLACEDHSRPPSSFTTSLLLERKRVRPREGLPALVGEWLGPAFWGPPVRLTVQDGGGVVLGDQAGQLAVRPGGHLEITAGGAVSRCRYRALEDRLTLRCGPAGAPEPEQLGGPDSLQSTVVFRRAGAAARGPVVVDPRGPAVAREGGDTDGDGLRNDADQCPQLPEDYDAFEDEDGCPEPDNDRDGILDVDDQCPNDPEDRDGRQDEDGCPDP